MSALTKLEISGLLPHEGSMCLLDSVEGWDETTIHCRATSHRSPDNPLRHGTGLSALAGLEYAAQAMGIHVGLLNPERSTNGLIGYVGAVRDVTIGRERLDKIPGQLTIEADRLLEGENSFMYQFRLIAEGEEIMTGRASIFLKRVE
jgi:predicted hotdog family 3-hydroxylacyl-ACP dehydratase